MKISNLDQQECLKISLYEILALLMEDEIDISLDVFLGLECQVMLRTQTATSIELLVANLCKS